MMNISDAISFGSKELTNAGIENARRDASLLLSNTFERDAAFLISHPEYELAEHEKQKFETEIRRRAKREPLQHILGRQEFFGLEFAVSPEVLIPRPETELIVEEAIRIFADRGDFRFLEIGVGSGCISILILKNLPQATAVGAD
ncbi:MAG: N5-glutamine methyltransferase family protein, partial [Pyrinomonadaceae bacterium]